MRKLILAIIFSSIAVGSALAAAVPVGGTYYKNEGFTSTLTLISATSNVSGVEILTLLGTCSPGVSLPIYLVPPSPAPARLILECANASEAVLPYPISIPAGWAVQAVPISGAGNIYFTYNFIGS